MLQALTMDAATPERRMSELEREYALAHFRPGGLERLDELWWQLAGLVGKNNLHLLREYTDFLAEHYNADPDWFYQKGVEDGGRPGGGQPPETLG